MKIAFLIGEFPRSSQPFIINQIEGVVESGIDVDIYSTGPPSPDDYQSVDDKTLAKTTYTTLPSNKLKRLFRSLPHFSRVARQAPTKLPTVANPFQFGKDALALKPLYRLSAMLDSHYDIIHAHFGQTARIGAILKSADMCTRLVATFHGTGVREMERELNRHQHLLQTGDLFMPVSQSLYDDLFSYGVDKERISLHYNGIQLHRFPFRWDTHLDRLPDKIKIITVARLENVKGLQYGVEAVSNISNQYDSTIEYHLVGDGSQRERLESLSTNLGMRDKVIFHGHKQRNEVIDHLENAHLFLLPSVSEGFGMVLLEAQAVGLPIIASNVGGIPEAVDQDSAATLVPPANPEAIRSAIELLLEQPEEWVSKGKAGRSFVERNFDVDHLNEELINKYKKII